MIRNEHHLIASTAWPTWKRVAVYLALWIPIFAMYWVVFLFQDQREFGPTQRVYAAATNVAAPLLLGAIIWWLTGRIPIPARKFGKFIAAHMFLLASFVFLWTAWVAYLMSNPHVPASAAQMVRQYVLPWQSVAACYMYGLIAGVSYSIRGALRVRNLELLAERADRLRAQAELAALRAHINPHFLFNTLHTVTALLRTNPSMAEEALDRLSALLRYVLRLDRHGVELVTIEDEWHFVEQYLWLEQLRMGERLQVRADLDDEALACAVPPFTLQPLVENAVRHGLAPQIAGGTLYVSAHEAGGRVQLEVRDDGVGAHDEHSGVGLGVRAVTQRLQARHGNAATAASGNVSPSGFSVRLSFPAEFAPVGASVA